MYLAVEETEVCQRATVLADRIYSLVREWDAFDRDTVGKQLVKATDSVGANLVEGDGRRSGLDSLFQILEIERSRGALVAQASVNAQDSAYLRLR